MMCAKQCTQHKETSQRHLLKAMVRVPYSGTYLPVTAVLGGLLYAKPDGYMEAQRDVIRLSSDLRELQKQQGYATCEPEDGKHPADASPLHCSFLVIPAQACAVLQPSTSAGSPSYSSKILA